MPDAWCPCARACVPTTARPLSARRLLIAAKARIIGAAEGTIMPTIMTAHMMKVRTKVPLCQACRLGMDMSMPFIVAPTFLLITDPMLRRTVLVGIRR